MSPEQLISELRNANVPNRLIDEAIGREHPAGSRLMGGKRMLKAIEIAPLTKLLHQWRKEQAALQNARADAFNTKVETIRRMPDQPPVLPDETPSYVPIPVLPMYGGMGGGGIGEVLADDDLEKILVPRYLIEDQLRGRAQDFLWIRVRGDSMEPDFRHDDELICDLRDTSPMQPGPFALFHEDGYYVKNVERTHDGQVRIFSSNMKYSSVEIASEQTRIIGRPVWFGRRL